MTPLDYLLLAGRWLANLLPPDSPPVLRLAAHLAVGYGFLQFVSFAVRLLCALLLGWAGSALEGRWNPKRITGWQRRYAGFLYLLNRWGFWARSTLPFGSMKGVALRSAWTPLRAQAPLWNRVRAVFSLHWLNLALWALVAFSYDRAVYTAVRDFVTGITWDSLGKIHDHMETLTSAATLLVIVGLFRSLAYHSRAKESLHQDRLKKALQQQEIVVRQGAGIWALSAANIDFVAQFAPTLTNEVCKACTGGLYTYDEKTGLQRSKQWLPFFAPQPLTPSLEDYTQHLAHLDTALDSLKQDELSGAWFEVNRHVPYETIRLWFGAPRAIPHLRGLERAAFTAAMTTWVTGHQEIAQRLYDACAVQQNLLSPQEWASKYGKRLPDELVKATESRLFEALCEYQLNLRDQVKHAVFEHIALEVYCRKATVRWLGFLGELFHK